MSSLYLNTFFALIIFASSFQILWLKRGEIKTRALLNSWANQTRTKMSSKKKAKMSLSTISTRYDHKLNTERTNGDKYGENAKKRQSYASRIMTRWHSELSKEKFIIQLFHCYLSRNFITSNRFIHRLTQFYFASSLL